MRYTRRYATNRKGPVTPYDREELAWAAGFFDGEGHIGTVRNGNHRGSWPMIRLSISQKGRPLLERFQRAVGVGKVYDRSSRALNDYTVSARDEIHRVMWMLWPWLGDVKRQQFHVATERYRNWRPPENR